MHPCLGLWSENCFAITVVPITISTSRSGNLQTANYSMVLHAIIAVIKTLARW